MQIKKRLRIQVAVSVVTALIICLVFFLSLYRINKVSNLTKIAGDIVTNSLERITFSNDYIWNNSERAKEQWFAKHKQIARILKSASENFRSVEDRYNIGEMIKHHESIGNIFSAIAANREKSSLNPESAEFSREFEDRMLTQMNMIIYDVVLHDRELLESSRKARASVLRQTGESIICLLAIAVALAGFSSWAMGRTITERVGWLRDGALVIGEGDLDHRIDITGDDEFAELSEAFNVMTAKLRGSYRELEKENDERKQTEERLQLQAQMLDSVGQAVIATDIGQSILYWNKTAAGMFGWSSEEVLGRSLTEILPPQVSPAMRHEVEATMASGETWSGEIVVQCRDKRPIPLFTTNSPLFDEQGRLVAIIGIGADITERKQAEKLLQRHAEELEASNRELTRFNSASMGREIRMIELKKEINELCRQIGQPPRYPLDFDKEQS
jgi:PAS domain S-box-containing protein